MDNKLSSSRLGIGWSSNLAMLSLTYYWTELAKKEECIDKVKIKELYDNFVILAVLAQVAIDSCKKEFTINSDQEIKRIQNLSCMQYVRYEMDSNGKRRKYKYDFPEFMKYVREPDHTKNGKLIPYEIIKFNRDKLNKRINPDFICPMNWLVECLNSTKIKRQSTLSQISVKNFFIEKNDGLYVNVRQLSKIRMFVSEYDKKINNIIQNNSMNNDEKAQNIIILHDELINNIRKMRMGFATIRRIIETALGIENNIGVNKEIQNVNKKYKTKILSSLYLTNKELFLKCFKIN